MRLAKQLRRAWRLSRENINALIKFRSVRFGYDSDLSMYTASEGALTRFHPNLVRLLTVYRRGIEERAESLFKSYCLEAVDFKKGDVIIDCGANSGDLFLSLGEAVGPSNYFCVEPNPDDFESLKSNCPQSNLLKLALSNTDGKLKFYVKTDSADSSVISPGKGCAELTVDSIRLDTLIKRFSLSNIKLLKLEAEGYEPEVLEGLGDLLGLCEYIAVDGGYERGDNKEQTFTDIANLLIQNRFAMIDISFENYRALYQRR